MIALWLFEIPIKVAVVFSASVKLGWQQTIYTTHTKHCKDVYMLYIMPHCSSAGGIVCLRLSAQVASDYY